MGITTKLEELLLFRNPIVGTGRAPSAAIVKWPDEARRAFAVS